MGVAKQPVWAALAFVAGFLPWLRNVWALVSSKPLFESILEKWPSLRIDRAKISKFPKLAFVTLPIGLSVFGVIAYNSLFPRQSATAQTPQSTNAAVAPAPTSQPTNGGPKSGNEVDIKGSNQVQGVFQGSQISNSQVNIAGHDLTINNGPTPQQNKQALLEALEEFAKRNSSGTSNSSGKGVDLSSIFPYGYAIFAISNSREVVPIVLQGGAVTADWANSWTDMTRDEIALHLKDVDTPFLSIGSAKITMPRELDATQGIILIGPGERALFLSIVKASEVSDVLVLGVSDKLQSKAFGNPRYSASYENLHFK